MNKLKNTHLYIIPCQQNLQKEIYPGATPFTRAWIQNVLQKALVSVQLFSAEEHPEEHPETQAKTEKTLLDGVKKMSSIFFVFSFFYSHGHLIWE